MTLYSYLFLSLGLYLVMIIVQALLATRHYGLSALAGGRDNLAEPSTLLARANRAVGNMIESLIIFIPLALVAIYTQTTQGLVLTGAALFFWGRLIYAPVYWIGLPWLRTLMWTISLVGLIVMFFGLTPLI